VDIALKILSTRFNPDFLSPLHHLRGHIHPKIQMPLTVMFLLTAMMVRSKGLASLPRRAIVLSRSLTEVSEVEEVQSLPEELVALMGEKRMLPVQKAAYEMIFRGEDAVVHSPTGTGKTWSFVLPLAAQLMTNPKANHEHGAKAVPRKDRREFDKKAAVSPKVIVVAPSRELAKQVGKEFSHFVKGGKVSTVFGGAPLERHSHQLRTNGGSEVVVGTAGRLRELVREGHLSFSRLSTLVLDEADVLLNAKDQPEVKQFLDDMKHDYQLVLCSATINAHVRRFAKSVMELTDDSANFITVDPEESANGGAADAGAGVLSAHVRAPRVRHWSLAAGAKVRRGVAADLVATMEPRTAIVFVKTKAECEEAAAELASRLGGQGAVVHVLHGDMPQPARARTIAQLRSASASSFSSSSSSSSSSSLQGSPRPPRVLVATDVAARGLDLPGVDLVLQFGVPRLHGKDGTFDPKLYTHRTGRAGRVGGGEANVADAVLMFDPSDGEAGLLLPLQAQLKLTQPMETLAPPTCLEVVDAAFSRADRRCLAARQEGSGSSSSSSTGGNKAPPQEDPLVSFFTAKLLNETLSSSTGNDLSSGKNREEELVRRLASAMVALSGLKSMPSPRSLLTADPADRTVRVIARSSNRNPGTSGGAEEEEEEETGDGSGLDRMSPAKVTRACKSLGSGKLGRVTVLPDGHSAVFDLPARKAESLVRSANAATTTAGKDKGLLPSGWVIDLPESLFE
jgi:superfamily II DNA/RNA helicase